MPNKLTTFAQKYGMKQDKKNHYYGVTRGYETNFMSNSLFNSMPYGFEMHISCHLDDDTQRDLLKYEATRPMNVFKIFFTPYGFRMSFNGMTTGSALKSFEIVLNQVLSILTQHAIKGNAYCPMCDELINEDQCQKISFFQHTITLHKDCAAKANADTEKENYRVIPNNVKKGIWGALIGATAGSVITVILFFFNLISAWSPIVGILLGSFLYKKFGGKANGIMISICFGFTLVFQSLAVFLLHVAAANGLAIANNIVVRGFDAFNYFMKSDATLGNSKQTFASAFTYNMILSTFFSIIGCALASIDIFRRAKAKRGF